MKLTKEQINLLINAAITLMIILLSIFGYDVVILDPARRIIVERTDRLAAAVQENNVQLETLAQVAMRIPPETPPKVEPTPPRPPIPPFIAGGITHYSGLSLQPQEAISVTEGLTLTLTGTSQPLESAGDATFNLPSGAAGDLLLLVNTVNHTLTLTDTASIKLAGDWQGGQYDALLVWCDGTNWIEVGRSDN